LNGVAAPRSALGRFQNECGHEADAEHDHRENSQCVLEEERLGDRSYRVQPGSEDSAVGDFAALKVPDGHLFVLGDNRQNSLDSRHFGPVPADSVVGVVTFVLLAFKPGGEELWWERVNQRVH
jgi:signal peptidase I